MFTDANCPSECNADSYAYEYTQCYTNGYGHGHRETNANSKAQRNSEATSHTAAAPLKGTVTNHGCGNKQLLALVRWRGDSGGARVSRAGFGVHAETNFGASWLALSSRYEKSAAARTPSPERETRVLPGISRLELQSNALLKLTNDGFGLLRYVQSCGRLHRFISRNTASTRARLGENSHTGSVSAALPVSNAA